jgi:pantetheine-phosphate adenylyltransferase
MKAIFPASFDPITLGHMDIIKRASKMFSLTIGVATNPNKQYLLPQEISVSLINASLREANIFANVAVVSGLLVDFCKEREIEIVIRGLRNSIDFEYEFSMAHINRGLGNIETIFFPAAGSHTHISSSAVKELSKYGADKIKNYVPAPVFTHMLQRYGN